VGWAGVEWSRRGRNDKTKNNGEARIRRRQIGRAIMVARDECEKRDRLAGSVSSPIPVPEEEDGGPRG